MVKEVAKEDLYNEMDNIPPAVQKQAEEADKALKAFAKPQEQVDEAQPSLEKPATDLSVTEPTKPDEKKEQVAKPVELENQVEKERDVWKHKFKVLQGKYDKEVPVLHAEVKELKANVEAIEAAGIETNKDQQQPLLQQDGKHLLNPKDFEGYDGEMLQLVNAVNSLAAVQDSQKENVNTLDKLDDYITKDAQEKTKKQESSFFNKVTSAVEGKYKCSFEAVNIDPEFLQWLAENDEHTGMTRQEILDTAHNRLNDVAATNVFCDFLSRQTTKKRELPSQNLMENTVVPDTAGGGKFVSQNDVALVTEAQLAEAAKNFASGRSTESDYNKLSDRFQKQLQR